MDKNIEMVDRNGGPPSIATVSRGLDANRYATKKTIAQGLLDVALLTANASQLKYVLTVGKQHDFYTAMVGMIGASIVLQVAVGVFTLSLNFFRDCRVQEVEYKKSSICIGTLNLVIVFFITILNLLISAFDPTLGAYGPTTS